MAKENQGQKNTTNINKDQEGLSVEKRHVVIKDADRNKELNQGNQAQERETSPRRDPNKPPVLDTTEREELKR